MAKQLKVIKCPQCGSTQKTLVKEDQYICQSCETEYFLDNDDIHVHVKHHGTEQPAQPQRSDSRPIIKICVGIAIGLTVISITLDALRSKPPQTRIVTVTQPTLAAPARFEDKLDVGPVSTDMCFPLLDAQQNIFFTLVSKTRGIGDDPQISKDPEAGYFAVFTDLNSNKVIKESRVDFHSRMDRFSTARGWKQRKFEDGNIYLILNQRELFRLNPDNLSIEPITPEFFSKHKEFQSGIATIEFTYEENGSGLKILTNDGKDMSYYPIVDKIYVGDDEVYSAQRFMENLLKNHKEKIVYEFIGVWPPTSKVRKELLKLTYQDNVGGPKNISDTLDWAEGYDEKSRTYVGPTTKIRVLEDQDRNRIASFKSLTDADRTYFSPSVFYYDEKNLFIKVQANASPDAEYNLQKIDTNTGAVIWAIPAKSMTEMYPLGDGFLIKKSCHDLSEIDAQGQIKNTHTLGNEG